MRVITTFLLAALCLAHGSSETWQRLSDWVKDSNSGIFDVTSDSELSATYGYEDIHTTFAKPGIYASTNIPSNETIMDIPLNKILTVDSPFPNEPTPAQIQFQTLVSTLRAHNVTDATSLLALRLAYERHHLETHPDGPTSPFAPLVAHVASMTVHSPLAWTDPKSQALLSLMEPSAASPLTPLRQHHLDMAAGVHGVVAALLRSDTYADLDVDIADLFKDNATALASIPPELITNGKLNVPINLFADLWRAPAAETGAIPASAAEHESAFTEELFTWAYSAALAHGVGLHQRLTDEFSPDSVDTALLALVPGLHAANHRNPPHASAALQLAYDGYGGSAERPGALAGVRVVSTAELAQGSQVALSYGSYLPALRVPAYATAPHASFLARAGAHTLLLAPSPPVPNSVLLLQVGAALPLNVHEPLILHAEVRAQRAAEAGVEAGAAGAGAGDGNAETDQQRELWTRLITRDKLPVAAVISLHQPLFHGANLGLVQTLRATHLRVAELERLLESGRAFDPQQGFFSLHNELQTLLELSGSLESLLQRPGEGEGVGADAGAGVVIGTPLHMDLQTLAQLLPRHARAVGAAQGRGQDHGVADASRYRRAAVLSHTISVKRVVLESIRGAYQALADMFEGLTLQWAEDRQGMLAGAAQWREEGRGGADEEGVKWVEELDKWARDMDTWRVDMDKWQAESNGWKREVEQVEQAILDFTK